MEAVFHPYVQDGHLILSPSGDYIPADDLTREYHVECFRYVLVAIYALFIWEWVVTSHEEWARWKQAFRGEFIPVNLCLIVSRWTTLGALIVSAVVFFGERVPDCQGGLYALYFFFQPGQICHVIICVLRVRALATGKRWIWRPLAVLGFAVCTLWIISIPFFKMGPVPGAQSVHYQPVCTPLPSPNFRVMGWGAAMLFDMIVCAISVFLIQTRLHPAFSAQARRFMSDSTALLFLVSISANAACFFTLLLYKNIILANIPIPIQFILNSVVGIRIILHTDVWMGKGKTGLLVIPHNMIVENGAARGGSVESKIVEEAQITIQQASLDGPHHGYPHHRMARAAAALQNGRSGGGADSPPFSDVDEQINETDTQKERKMLGHPAYRGSQSELHEQELERGELWATASQQQQTNTSTKKKSGRNTSFSRVPAPVNASSADPSNEIAHIEPDGTPVFLLRPLNHTRSASGSRSANGDAWGQYPPSARVTPQWGAAQAARQQQQQQNMQIQQQGVLRRGSEGQILTNSSLHITTEVSRKRG